MRIEDREKEIIDIKEEETYKYIYRYFNTQKKGERGKKKLDFSFFLGFLQFFCELRLQGLFYPSMPAFDNPKDIFSVFPFSLCIHTEYFYYFLFLPPQWRRAVAMHKREGFQQQQGNMLVNVKLVFLPYFYHHLVFVFFFSFFLSSQTLGRIVLTWPFILGANYHILCSRSSSSSC